jgi:tetratricopeptide (TPR) repeat protein
MHTLEQSLLIADQIGTVRDQVFALNGQAQVYMAQENWLEARNCLRRMQDLNDAITLAELQADLAYLWGLFYLSTGDYSQAQAHLKQAIDTAITHHHPLEEGLARSLMGQVHLARKETALAAVSLGQGLQILNDLNSDFEVAKTKLALAHLTMGMGEIEEALDYLKSALATFKRVGAKVWQAKAEKLLAQLGG